MKEEKNLNIFPITFWKKNIYKGGQKLFSNYMFFIRKK